MNKTVNLFVLAGCWECPDDIGVTVVAISSDENVLTKVIDFAHILMYIRSRKRDNVKEGVPLPITKVEH